MLEFGEVSELNFVNPAYYRYAVCGDQTIRNFAKMRPSTGARLANIDGVNQVLL
jgi:hypothetical protein